MRATILLQELLGLQQTQVQGFEFTETGLVVDVAPQTRSPHCAGCCRRCRRGYDGRERTWRHVDLGGIRVELRYEIRRIPCTNRRCCGACRVSRLSGAWRAQQSGPDGWRHGGGAA